MTFKKNNNQQKPKKKSNFAKVGALLRNQEGGFYIKFDKDTEIEINGVRVTGLTASCEKPTDKFERMLAVGAISEEEAQVKMAKYQEGGELEYVRQEINIKLD